MIVQPQFLQSVHHPEGSTSAVHNSGMWWVESHSGMSVLLTSKAVKSIITAYETSERYLYRYETTTIKFCYFQGGTLSLKTSLH